ncbi:GntR family transcriptional regulator [Burkholderia pseudomallei]|uniref:FadR/GntR family transcriptional regulator n=1 Tax=Burkholderia pseudomallei TaxID=28450 RepID=UPI00104CCEF1|nr:GntR family transcriptional regulator [Burkholderia pseudomallei]MCV9914944.1 GntR family transcriptional regulator [Burkholderia pseudomallei]MCW0070982.1 GntR family transcriptional regulator [Burkholderia pseudomallei]TCW75589.1 FadR family transcriptional regulator [Burkholderia sp. SRS-46]
MNSDALNTLLTPPAADETEDSVNEPSRGDRLSQGAFSDLTRSRVEVSLDLLAGTIVTRSYPDQLLPPQDVLAAEFGVSRTVLREAISRLLARNMVEVRPKSGTRIVDARQWRVIDQEVVRWRQQREPDASFQRDLAAVRQLLEPLAAAEAAVYSNDATREQILAACYRRLAPINRADYEKYRETLHVAILAACRNQLLRQMTCFAEVRPHVDLDDGGALVEIADGERQALALLAAAFRDRDAAGAFDAMERVNAWDLTGMRGGHV